MTPAISHMLLETLKLTPLSYAEMEEATGLNRQTLARWVNSVRADSLVRICGWGPDTTGRPIVPQFEFGGAPDAERPTPKTALERVRASRERRRLQ